MAFTAGVDGLVDGEMAAGDETPATEEVPTGATNLDGWLAVEVAAVLRTEVPSSMGVDDDGDGFSVHVVQIVDVVVINTVDTVWVVAMEVWVPETTVFVTAHVVTEVRILGFKF